MPSISWCRRHVDSWKEEGPDEKNEDDYPHETSYDVLIIGMLFNLLKSIPTNLCDDPKKDDKFKADMDAISDKIRAKLDMFNGANGATPADSSPFFVSMRAYEFSGIAKKLPNADLPGNPASL